MDTQTETGNLLSTEQDGVALSNDNTKIQRLKHRTVRKPLPAGHNMVLTYDAANDKIVELAIDFSPYYTPAAIHNICAANTNTRTTDCATDTSTPHQRNCAQVGIVEESAHINVETRPTKLSIKPTATSDLPSFFTQTDMTNVLNTKT